MTPTNITATVTERQVETDPMSAPDQTSREYWRGVLVAGGFTAIPRWAANPAVGVAEHEVPVVYRATGQTTVAPLRDSWRALIGTFELRRRLRDVEASVPAPQTV